MIERRLMSEMDGKLIGLRIKASRVLTGLNQEEFCTKHGFALPSLKTWELGVVPRTEGVLRLIDAFKNDGVFVNSPWLLFGHGTGPSFHLATNEVNNTDDSVWQAFKKECIRLRDNPIFCTVANDEMEPLFSNGDAIFGKLFEVQTFVGDAQKEDIGKPLLVRMDQGYYEPRWVHLFDGKFFSRSLKTPALRNIEFPSFAKICWHQSSR